MSDYIRKSDLMGALLCCDSLGRKKFAEVLKKINELPTVDEKEIIRKPMERIVERLEEKMESVDYWTKPFDKYEYYDNGFWEGINEVVTIVKEEGGME